MDELDEFLNNDELLFWISSYELHRPDGKLFIHVCELMTGPKKGMHIAYPTILARSGDRKFLGSGESSEEALKECLKRIKGVPISEIIPA